MVIIADYNHTIHQLYSKTTHLQLSNSFCNSRITSNILNRFINLRRKEHKNKDSYQKQRDRDAKDKEKLKAQERKLATVGLSKEIVPAYAERDVSIISRAQRTKNSMKK